MTLAAKIAAVRSSADRLGQLVDEWNEKFGQPRKPTMSLTAYVTYTDGAGEDRFNCITDGVDVHSSGALYLISEVDNQGQILEGHIIAPGQWREVNLQTEVFQSDATPLPLIQD